MKKKYVKIMFLSLTLLTISTTATYAVQPKDDKKENEALQTSTEEHLPLLTINGTMHHHPSLSIPRLYSAKK